MPFGRKRSCLNYFLYQFCKCWIYERYSGIRGRLDQDDEFKC